RLALVARHRHAGRISPYSTDDEVGALLGDLLDRQAPRRLVPAVGPDERAEDEAGVRGRIELPIRLAALLRLADQALDVALVVVTLAQERVAPILGELLDVVVVDRDPRQVLSGVDHVLEDVAMEALDRGQPGLALDPLADLRDL